MSIFSKCNKYRYVLWRTWDNDKPKVMFIGLNPSTADAKRNDPTIRRCINFAKRWGFGGMYVCNLFAFKATHPNVLLANQNPVGNRNDYYLKKYLKQVPRVVVAWGNHGTHLNRHLEVMKFLEHPYCLKINKSGQPTHPLYQKAESDLIPFNYV